MKNDQDLLQFRADVRAVCERLADKKQAEHFARWFREGLDAHGIDHKNPAWIESKDRWFARAEAMTLGRVLDLGDLLFEGPKYEERAVALLLAGRHIARFTPAAFRRTGRWLELIENWAHCDVLCGEVLGPVLAAGVVDLDAMAAWRGDSHKFKRRGVPVTMLALLKGNPKTGPLLDFIRSMMTDSERVVHQGLGWFLRECWKLEPRATEKFLLTWKDTAARLIFQYATEKMTPEAKARFKRTRAAAAKA